MMSMNIHCFWNRLHIVISGLEYLVEYCSWNNFKDMMSAGYKTVNVCQKPIIVLMWKPVWELSESKQTSASQSALNLDITIGILSLKKTSHCAKQDQSLLTLALGAGAAVQQMVWQQFETRPVYLERDDAESVFPYQYKVLNIYPKYHRD